jgi:FixJ family two-component response regulator
MPAKPVISIVDDDASVREGLADLLNSMGFKTNTFRSGEEFLRSDWLPVTNCLVTDYRMPGMTGLELYRRLAGASRRIPTIMITAFPNEADRARALRAGMSCYLPKPFDETELLGCIRSALGSNGKGTAQ